jgi:alpha,alpha-trehalose-phosphate synthase [UDP-forming]
MWTQESLCELVNSSLEDYLFIVASNREPYVHIYLQRGIAVQRPVGGLTVALDPVMKACGGTWIAHGSGSADKEVVDEKNKVMVPPEDPRYALKRVWLSKQDETGYYYGFANDGLWPLCHIVYRRPIFDEADWNVYKKVNSLFADSVLEEVGDKKAFVFIQDYHLALLPKMLKDKNPNIVTAQFWHIPWPNQEAFSICPWDKEILDGLLSNDVLGFHTRYHCLNFMDTVDRTIEARIDKESNEIIYGGKKTGVLHFPISVDFDRINEYAPDDKVTGEIERLKSDFRIDDEIVGVGMDRIDYTKGIPDRLKALDRFLDKYPQYQGRVVFVQAGAESRVGISSYQKLNEEIEYLVSVINWKYGEGRWRPIVYIKNVEDTTTLMALRRMSDFCIVSSLHDGMNLVAKEYVASRFNEDGVLILSQFTGAARELTDALLINPYATDQLTEAIKKAIEMPKKEQKRRMQKMREIVRENNIYKWAADIVTEIAKKDSGK